MPSADTSRPPPSERRPPSPDRRPPRKRLSGLVIWVVLGLLLLWSWQRMTPGMMAEELTYGEFKQALREGRVSEVSVGPEVIEGELTPEDGEGEPTAFHTVRIQEEDLVDELEAAGIEYEGQRPSVLTQVLVAWILPLGVIVLLWVLLARRMRESAGAAMSFGRNKARLIAENQTGVDFDDVAGCDEAKGELQEVVRFLREPEHFRALGARIPKGVLLVGPPGTGKTLLARAVAGEAKVPFYSLSGSDFVEMFVGVGAARVRDLFEQATAQAPCIVFIDELDAIGRHRGAHVGMVNDEREQTLNQLLVELDGFEPNQGVVILAATNRPDVLDRALLRPGRFDRQVILDAPDAMGRKAILRVHLSGKPLDDDIELDAIARATPGFSGADLANAINEAALMAARREAKTISQHDLEEAVEKVVAGPERRSRRLAEEERRRVAVHESGHALVATLSEHADPVEKISIVPRGKAALGYTLQLPTDDRHLMTEAALRDRIVASLGGRAAEEVVFGEVSTGAHDDLQKATALARQMVTMFGMSDRIGLPYCARPEGEAAWTSLVPRSDLDCSPQTAREVDEEVRDLLAEAYQTAKRRLSEHRHTLDRLTETLLEKESLDRAAFEGLVAEVEQRREPTGPAASAP